MDGWAINGGANASNQVVYLRGKGKDLYNMYQFKYGGVDQATGLPLFASTVSKENIDGLRTTSGSVIGGIQEGNTVYDRLLAWLPARSSARPSEVHRRLQHLVPLERPRLRGYVRIPVTAVSSSAPNMR
ncbi:MAG: hypothetical protein ACLR8Y_05920 [Alistipes indistinctus]